MNSHVVPDEPSTSTPDAERSPAASGGDPTRRRLPVRAIVLAVVVGLALLAIPETARAGYYQYSFITASALAIAGLGFYLVYQVGGVTFAQAGFMAIGAYTSGLLSRELGWSVFLTALVAIAVTVALGALIGVLITRARSEFHFILVTFAFSEVVRLSLTRWVYGADGIPGIPSPELFGYSFRDPTRYYWLSAVVLLLCAALVWRLMHSGLGRMLLSVREGELHLAPSFGIRPETYKVLAFAIASGLAGLAGAVQGHFTNFASPDQFGLQFSVLILTAAVIGGVGYIAGPIVGALVLVSLERYLSEFPGTSIVVYGVVLVLVMLVLPEGLVGLFGRLSRLRRFLPDKSNRKVESS
jgi:branched-chain amino acid transport system permease protein